MTQTGRSGPWTPTAKALAAGILALWLGLAYLLGSTGLLTAPPSETFRPVALTAFIPVAIFFTAYALSNRLRGLVLLLDIRDLTMLQHWRVIGFAFLLLYANDVLPALFAWPAGIGDVLIGLAAPLVVARLARDPNFARSWRFVTYHALGLLDFVVAVVTASLASGAVPGLVAGPVTSGPMEVWPLNLFPSFIVPIFIILHVIAFLKIRALRRADNGPVGAILRAT